MNIGPDDHLNYADLDKSLLVWGNALNGRVLAAGRGFDGHDLADARWDPQDPSTGDITYYHPDSGWMNAATGRPIKDERELER